MTVETVTVLFTDLVGSTELMARVGETAMEAVRREHMARLRDAIDAAGGREVKNLGDGVMVAFDGAGAALACAVGMQQAIAGQRTPGGEPLAIRVGVSIGEADVVDGDYFGIPVVESARLCAHAAGGEILTTELVRVLVRSRGGFDFDRVGPVELKGLPEPVETFRLRWEPVAASGGLVPVPQRVTAAADGLLVGRRAEQEVLRATLKDTAEGVRCVFVSGEPGIGKTTLVAQAAAEAGESGAVVLYGRCDEDLGIPYQPWVEALGHLVSHIGDDVVDAHVDAAGPVLTRLLPELARRTTRSAGDGDLDVERHRLLTAITDLLSRAAAVGPVVLVVDDLHWADPGTVQVLRHLLLTDSTARMSVLGTFRDSDLGAAHPMAELLARLHREPTVQRVALTGLGDDEVLAWLERLAGHDLDDDGVALRDALLAETEGNPFFISELLRHLAASGALHQDASGRWVASDDLRTAGLPVSIREVVGRRVRWLGGESHRLLTLASVVGREFDVDLVARVADLDPDTVIDLCDAAVTAAVLRETGQLDRYAFAHALIERSLYDELSASRRARAHHAVAEALEVLCAADPAARAGELAHHWAMATRPADAAKAFAYARLAGDRAMEHLAPADAIRWYRDALTHLGPEGQGANDGIAVRVALLRAMRLAGQTGFREVSHDAASDALRAGLPDLAAQALLEATPGYAMSVGNVDHERIGLLRAARAALDHGVLRTRITAQLASELTYDYVADDERASLRAEASAALAALDDPRVVVEVANLVVDAMDDVLTLDERRRLSAVMTDAAKTTGDLVSRMKALNIVGRVAMEHGDRAGLEAVLPEYRAAAAASGYPGYQAWPDLVANQIVVLDGDPDAIELQADSFLLRATEAGEPALAAVGWGAVLMTAGWMRGRLGDLLPLIEQTAADNPGLPVYRSTAAWALAHEHHRDDAARRLQAAHSAGFDHPRNMTWLFDQCTWTAVAAATQHRDAASVLLQRIEPWSHLLANTRTTMTLAVAHYAGLAHHTLGRHDQAIARFEQALDMHHRLRAPFMVASTELALAETLTARNTGDDRHRALDLATGVHTTAVERGYGYLQRDAASLLEQLS